MSRLACAMYVSCSAEVSMIDEQGYVYCASHGVSRRSGGTRCRKLRPHELRRLERTGQIERY